jgi:non-canonical purine NTP pyrophosphatase (RdgB/HAM1 family)
MDIYFITSNKGKLEEVRAITGMDIRSKSIEIEEIQDVSVENVVKDKAVKAYSKIHKPVIVEDTGLYIKALNGFPGALVKWLVGAIGPKGICRIIGKYNNRSAYAETRIAFYDGKTLKTFSGRIYGRISGSPIGANGFGWDPIFIPSGQRKTFAQMGASEKNEISHRRKAALKLKEFLYYTVNHTE